jgi:hypothetical protein
MVGDNKLGGDLDESPTVMVGSGENRGILKPSRAFLSDQKV